jgi:hypothetical protein
VHRQNRELVRFRPSAPVASRDHEGRCVCRECGATVPRGQDRPFCLEHAPYARQVRRDLAGR